MTTTHDSNATPGTLKAALALWMALMAGLLGYSISTAEATPEPHTAESKEDHGTETPAGGEAGHEGPTKAPSVPGSTSPAATPSASSTAH